MSNKYNWTTIKGLDWVFVHKASAGDLVDGIANAGEGGGDVPELDYNYGLVMATDNGNGLVIETNDRENLVRMLQRMLYDVEGRTFSDERT